MNPLTNVKNIKKLSEIELKSNGKSSWHDDYKGSAWLFLGGLPYTLTEGDIITVFSQYGEIVNINLIRDKDSGKSKGFAFLCYEDQRSTILAVDNLNSIKILGRTIRVDHVSDYKPPTEKKGNEHLFQLHVEGCAPKLQMPKAEMQIKKERKEIEEKPKRRDKSRYKDSKKNGKNYKEDKRERYKDGKRKKDKKNKKHKSKEKN